jgi:hypothetical protein
VLDLLEARAQFDGPERAVHIRTAEHAGHIYLDLADEQWRAVDSTDDEEVLFEAARPILLNGIEEVVSRPDLGDRAIF